MKKFGFTLIELLVVIAIIGILTAVGAISYQRAVQLSRDSRRKTDLEQLRQALETYRSEVGYYPSSATWSNDLVPDYINSLPVDPKTGSYTYVAGGGANATVYSLCATLEIPPNPPMTLNRCGAPNNYEATSP